LELLGAESPWLVKCWIPWPVLLAAAQTYTERQNILAQLVLISSL
jgi:hypothetical protein